MAYLADILVAHTACDVSLVRKYKQAGSLESLLHRQLAYRRDPG